MSSQNADRLVQACNATNQISIEAWIKPANLSQIGPSRIVSLSSNPYYRNFTLGQEGSEYEVRLRTTTTSENGTPAIVSSTNAVETKITHVVYTRNSDGETFLYVDGRKIINTQIAGELSNWDDGLRLMLGNEMTSDRPWLGDYYWVAIYNRALQEGEVSVRFEAGPGGYLDPVDPTATPTPSQTPFLESTDSQESGLPTATVHSQINNVDNNGQNDENAYAQTKIMPVILVIILGLILLLATVWLIRRLWFSRGSSNP